MDRKGLELLADEYLSQEQDSRFREELINVISRNDAEELNDRFYTNLKFGTAGMRGKIGGGYNRMNPYIVKKVTQGLAEYISNAFPHKEPVVVIAYDTRNYSKDFAESAAEVLCGNRICTYLFETVHPVPMLSYSVRKLEADAGIVITASHNPPEYNGYKVYWNEGGQVLAPHDEGIVESVLSITDASAMKSARLETAAESGLLTMLENDFDEDYFAMVENMLEEKQLFEETALLENNPVVYTPLHGSGSYPVQEICRRIGIPLHIVEEQNNEDGNFPTVSYPNPEEPEAMTLAVKKAKAIGAKLVLGTDPDADRLGIGYPDESSETGYRLLTGNQIASLFCDYLISRYKRNHGNPGDAKLFCVKSLVTTDLMRTIAERSNVACIDTLTGFKYIAVEIEKGSQEGRTFLFGAEESFGYNISESVRDKDAVSAAALAIEMMLWYANQGITLGQRLEGLKKEFGWFEEKVISKTLPGAKGMELRGELMNKFRTAAPKTFGGFSVTGVDDLELGEAGFPPAAVIILHLEGGRKVVVRPSGTEPKIKFYLYTSREMSETAERELNSDMELLGREIETLLSAH